MDAGTMWVLCGYYVGTMGALCQGSENYGRQVKTWLRVLCGSTENLQHSLSPAPSFGWVATRPVLIATTNPQIQICQNQCNRCLLPAEESVRKFKFANLYFVQSLHHIWRELVFGLHKLKLAPWGRLSLKYCLPTLEHGGRWEPAEKTEKQRCMWHC